MKIYFGLLLVWGLLIGCDEDSHYELGGRGGPVPSVTLVIATDTLKFLPGDSARTPITVLVCDQQGNVVEGERVVMTLSDPKLGFISFVDPLLRDTTNVEGRVDLQFTALGIERNEIIEAHALGRMAVRSLAIRVIPTVIEVEIGLIPLPEEFGQDITIPFSVLYTMTDGDPIAAKQLIASANTGRFLSFSETDNAGQASGELFINDDFIFEIHLSVTDGFAVGRDSTVISIGGD